MIPIRNKSEFDMLVARGYNPLIDPLFDLNVGLRISIQNELFGRSYISHGNIPRANQRFYLWIWEHKPHICEESNRPLWNYSAEFVSHILSRGAHPEMAHDPRNVNILFTIYHNQWENPTKQKKMRIFEKNQRIIEKLKKEYST